MLTSSLIDRQGFTIVPQVLDITHREALVETLGHVVRAGRRGLLALPIVRKLAYSAQLLDLVRPHLPLEPIPVRAIYFDKSPDANWLVTWHQDLTIAVKEKIEVEGFGTWSVKEGIAHVQAPVECLEQMLAVRMHLDDAGETNGALKVLPGTHKLGRLSDEQIQDLRTHYQEHLCTAVAGDTLLMRPLLLHASSRSTSERNRRVLHIEYAGFGLPAGLQWNEAA